MNNTPQTWHYGLVARYWAEHNKIEAIQGDYTEAEATADHEVIVFIARK